MRVIPPKKLFRLYPLPLFILGWLALAVNSKEMVHLGVSTSIQVPIGKICQEFSQATDFECKISSAPAGHLYAHVMHGMLYDILLLSSGIYIQGLINAQKADAASRFILASGRIVLWSADPNATAESLYKALMDKKDLSIVIANPGVSSYGKAAKEVLVGYNLWTPSQGRLVYGKSLQQALDLVASQKIPLGFVPLAKLSSYTRMSNRYWEPDISMYKPVRYEAILLKSRSALRGCSSFYEFFTSKEGLRNFNRGWI